jgi:pimeloyl-ACP methyl ester carboxylesterase
MAILISLALLSILVALYSGVFYRPVDLSKQPVEGNFVDVNGNTIHYLKSGHGPPVVLVHGFGAWSFSWRKNIKPLSKYFTVYAIDLLGFGLSDKPREGPYTIESQAALVSAFMENVGLKKATLIGNSLGGEIAMRIAVRYPGKVDSLILIDSSGYREKPYIPEWVPRPIFKATLRTFFLNRSQVEKTIRLAYYKDRLINSNIIDGYYLPTKTRGVEDALVSMSKQLQLGRGRTTINLIERPTLIVWGKHDQIIPVDDAFRLRRAIKHSRIVVINDAGHAPQEEKPAVVNTLIRAFIEDNWSKDARGSTVIPRYHAFRDGR